MLPPQPLQLPIVEPIPLPVPPAEPAPPPLQPFALPLACTPFTPNWPVHDMGPMNLVCPSCYALHWKDERLTKSSLRNPKFGKCCLSGKVHLPPLDPPPPELQNLFVGQDPRAKAFRNHIHKYNDALALTSVGRELDQSLLSGGGGPYVFKVHGSLSHRAGSLLPSEGQAPVYSQLYIYDDGEALNYQMGNRHNQGLDQTIMRELQDMLHRHHHGVTLYKTAWELTRNMPPEQQCTIALRYLSGTDQRRYNLPTITNEIAAVIPGDGDQPSNGRDIVFHRKAGSSKRISEIHPFYPAFHYVLLFPTGQMGWHPKIPYRDQETKYMSMREFLAYRLHTRTNGSNHLFRAGKLYFEYLVDSWAICEQNRLNYIKTNQGKLRADQYTELAAAVELNPQLNQTQVGTRVILPSSFSGSTRHMQAACQDALAVNRHFKGADLFITMTANPNWQEIKDALLPGEKPEDRPDLINRVFHAKRDALIKDIKDGIFGKCVGLIYTNEFQKRGLPHSHIIGFLDPASKLRTPEDIDSLLCSELPDPDTDPELFELVKKFMIHSPCGVHNPNSPCMKDGICSKGFPKAFRERTSLNEDSYARTRRRDTGRSYDINGKNVDNRWVVAFSIYLIWKYRCHIVRGGILTYVTPWVTLVTLSLFTCNLHVVLDFS